MAVRDLTDEVITKDTLRAELRAALERLDADDDAPRAESGRAEAGRGDLRRGTHSEPARPGS